VVLIRFTSDRSTCVLLFCTIWLSSYPGYLLNHPKSSCGKSTKRRWCKAGWAGQQN